MRLLITISFITITPFLSAQIGLVQRTYHDNNRDRTIETTIMYPAISDSIKKFSENRVFYGFNASIDAKPLTNYKLPLIILIRGTSGNWSNLSWLGAQLVTERAIVVAANHPGSITGDATPLSVIQLWNQPVDFSFLINNIFQSNFSRLLNEVNTFINLTIESEN